MASERTTLKGFTGLRAALGWESEAQTVPEREVVGYEHLSPVRKLSLAHDQITRTKSRRSMFQVLRDILTLNVRERENLAIRIIALGPTDSEGQLTQVGPLSYQVFIMFNHHSFRRPTFIETSRLEVASAFSPGNSVTRLSASADDYDHKVLSGAEVRQEHPYQRLNRLRNEIKVTDYFLKWQKIEASRRVGFHRNTKVEEGMKMSPVSKELDILNVQKWVWVRDYLETALQLMEAHPNLGPIFELIDHSQDVLHKTLAMWMISDCRLGAGLNDRAVTPLLAGLRNRATTNLNTGFITQGSNRYSAGSRLEPDVAAFDIAEILGF